MSTVGALYNCCRYLNGLDEETLFLEEEKKLLKKCQHQRMLVFKLIAEN